MTAEAMAIARPDIGTTIRNYISLTKPRIIVLLLITTVPAMVVAERLRLAVESTAISSARGSLSVSVSIGVAERSSNHSSLSEVLAISDAALYKAKSAGRNKVIAAGSEVESGFPIAKGHGPFLTDVS